MGDSYGIVYLIQPLELVGTDRYKIGISNNNNLDRCKNGYKKGSRYLCIFECNNPIILEQKIKDVFNKNFKLIAGNEYYMGNEREMKTTFIELYNNYCNLANDNKFHNYNYETAQYTNIKKLQIEMLEKSIKSLPYCNELSVCSSCNNLANNNYNICNICEDTNHSNNIEKHFNRFFKFINNKLDNILKDIIINNKIYNFTDPIIDTENLYDIYKKYCIKKLYISMEYKKFDNLISCNLCHNDNFDINKLNTYNIVNFKNKFYYNGGKIYFTKKNFINHGLNNRKIIDEKEEREFLKALKDFRENAFKEVLERQNSTK